jgi:hypothetical protein
MTRVLGVLCVAVGLSATAGCSGGGRVEDFTPAEANARKALVAALDHWQGGGQSGAIPNTSPAVQVTDARWKGGQKIKSYEIVGAEPPAGTGPRWFKVRLVPASGEAVETKYAVLGIDPLLVYRDEDYQKLSGMGR